MKREGTRFSMASYCQREAQISEPLPCPECGEVQLAHTSEDVTLADGLKIRKLYHLKCAACGSRLFDDQAMQRIQAARRRHASTTRRG